MQSLLLQHGKHIPKATAKRRVLITRQWGKGKRAYDYGNMVGGCKPLLDAMTRTNLIVDDRPSMLAEYYFQEKAPSGIPSLSIVIEDGEFDELH